MPDLELCSVARLALDELTDVVGAGTARDLLRLAIASLGSEYEAEREVSR